MGSRGYDKYDDFSNFYESNIESDKFNILGLSVRSGERKTKYTHPYNYDQFIVWFGNAQKDDDVVYSDRLSQWDYDKYITCLDAVRGTDAHQRFHNDDPKQVQEFLSLYYDKQVEVTAIVEGCNASNGYPYWIFYFRDKQ